MNTKKVKLVPVPSKVKKLKAGMYVRRPNGTIMQLAQSDADEHNRDEELTGERVWTPIELWLIIDGVPKDGEVYVDIRDSYLGVYKAESVTENFILEKQINRPIHLCKKVIAIPEEIGWFRDKVKEPLHEYFISELGINEINRILLKGGECEIEWEDNQCDGCVAGVPLEGKAGDLHRMEGDAQCASSQQVWMGCTADKYDYPKLVEGKVIIHIIQ